MANWNNPTVTSTYTNYTTEFRDRDVSLAKQFDSALVSDTNIPVDTIRWNSTSKLWQRYDGTTWNALASLYGISISGNAATATTAAACSGNAVTATTAAACSGNSATATSASACTGNSATASAVSWAGITSKPTTLSGYGITDAAAKTGATGQTFNVGSATALAHAVRADQIQTQALTAKTTGGGSTAYTLTTLATAVALTVDECWLVTFHVTAGDSPTLNRDSKGAKAIKYYDSTGTKQPCGPTTIISGMKSFLIYDGTDYVLFDQLPSANASTSIPTVTATVASSALTIGAVSQMLSFRSATLGDGTVTTITATPASLVVPSGATLGTVNAVQSRLVVLELLYAGAAELAVTNLAGGINLDETTLISTTTISSAADSANVIYSTTGRTSVPFRVVGFIDSTQATAGAWATAPSKVQGAGGQALMGLSSIGYGQTWQSVTRTLVTTYYNTTGKPIAAIAVYYGSGAGSIALTFTSNGMSTTLSGYTANSTMLLIPPGSYSFGNGGGLVGSSVYELR